MTGIQALTLERDYTMLLCTTDFDPEQEERYLRVLRAKHVDGALVDGLVLPPERIARFVEDGFPIVCLDRDVNSRAVPLVQVDNRMGARLATEHLLALGHTRIAHIMGAPARISEERLLGYQGALSRAGVEPDSSLVALGNFTETGGHDAMEALLAASPAPTAVFAANDLSAIGAINAIAASGRSVPGDISVVGLRRSAPGALHVAAADDAAAAGGGDRAPRDGAAARPDRRPQAGQAPPSLPARADRAQLDGATRR